MEKGKVLYITVVLIELVLIFSLLKGVFSGPEIQKARGDFTRNPSIDPGDWEEDAYVIAALGDSHTAGDFPNKSRAWPSKLENALRENSNGEYRVLSFAKPGMGLIWKVNRYSELYRDPDMLILQLSGDDPLNNSEFTRKAEKYMERNNISNNTNPMKHEYLQNLRVSMIGKAGERADEVYRREFNKLEKEVSNDTEVIVLHVNFPSSRREWVSKMVETRGWDYLDWKNFFDERAYEREDLVIESDNRHYNYKGNTVWAEELEDYLMENYELEE